MIHKRQRNKIPHCQERKALTNFNSHLFHCLIHSIVSIKKKKTHVFIFSLERNGNEISLKNESRARSFFFFSHCSVCSLWSTIWKRRARRNFSPESNVTFARNVANVVVGFDKETGREGWRRIGRQIVLFSQPWHGVFSSDESEANVSWFFTDKEYPRHRYLRFLS